MRLPAIMVISMLALQACGSKSGLPVPERSFCREVELSSAVPRVLFAVDRSGSMDFSLDGLPREDPNRGDAPSRWELMTRAVQLSVEERLGEMEVGALVFPNGEGVAGCGGGEFVQLEPAPGSDRRLGQLFAENSPQGGTPSGRALAAIAEYFADNPLGQTQPGFVVFITDGAPNCNNNPAVPPPTCVCTSTDMNLCDDRMNPDAALQCLDDVGARRSIETLASAGIPVYVMGITSDPFLTDVLNTFAITGGRPRPESSPERFYNAQTEAEVDAAFDEITSSITNCSFIASEVSDPSSLEVFVAGERIEEADWTFDPTTREITLVGTACTRASSGAEVTAELSCGSQGDVSEDAGDSG